MHNTVNDADLGTLDWNEELELWEGSILLESEAAFELMVFARVEFTPAREITADARAALRRLKRLENACRRYAADCLLDVHNTEWTDGVPIDANEFSRRLGPGTVEVHESGYAEVHFSDGGLFANHTVGVRLRSDGTFQEAVVEG